MVKMAGFRHIQGYFDAGQQAQVMAALEQLLNYAPLFQATMPRTGKPLSVKMSNCGPLGWVSDKKGGYRYQATHPDTGAPWPAMPEFLISLWGDVAECDLDPEACLINWYQNKARMGLHQDRDEEDFSAPVVSVSLGDDARFRVGGLKRNDPTKSLILKSGDVVVLGGEARLAFHGIDRIYPGTSDVVPFGGRINLTMRRVH